MRGIFLAIGMLACASTVHGSLRNSTVHVHLSIHLPKHFQQIDKLFISGNSEALGNWNPSAIAVQKSRKAGLWSFDFAAGATVEYKFTLGDWDHVEVDDSNLLTPNREVTCLKDCTVDVTVTNFRVVP